MPDPPETSATQQAGTQPTVTAPPVVTPKVARGRAKAKLTKAAGTLGRRIAENDIGAVQSQLGVLKALFDEFEITHDTYHDDLNDDNDIETSEQYFQTAINDYIKSVDFANEWLAEDDTTSEIQGASATASPDSVNFQSVVDMLSISQTKIDVFTGDPLEYSEFMSNFKENFGNKPMDDQAKLSRLLRFTSGDAKRAIRHCSVAGGSQGYQQALDILQERFGNEYIIAHRIIDKLKTGTAITTASDLQQLSNDLVMASDTLNNLNMFSEIENQKSVVDILNRCPKYIQYRWEKRALQHKFEKSCYPKFVDFVKFIKREAHDVIDPIYGRNGSLTKTSGKSESSKFACPAVASKDGNHTSGNTKFSNQAANRSNCVACNQPHSLFQCASFKEMNPKARFDLVKRSRLCYLCLSAGHGVATCTKKYTCSVPNCGQKHSKFIHLDFPPRSSVVPPRNDPGTPGTDTTQTNSHVNAGDTQVYLPLVPIKINSDPETYYALLDCASTCSFICEDLVEKLKLKRVNSSYKVNTISDQTHVKEIVSFELSDTNEFGSVHLNNVLVIPDIPTRNPSTKIDVKRYPHLQTIPLMQNNEAKASILIGMDNAHLLVPYEVKRNPDGLNEPYATLTYFGWALSGPVSGNGNSDCVFSHAIQGITDFVNFASNCDSGDLEAKIENLWQIESGPTDGPELSNDDCKVIQFWDQETEVIDNKYVVPIPWKQGGSEGSSKPVMPNNLPYAQHRLSGLMKRLERTDLTQRYDESIRKLLDKGYAEEVPTEEISRNDGSVWYVPHHHVIKETKDNKLRVVMDCSAKFRGTSFNNESYTGPNLMNNILPVLLRFRQYKYAVTCDIEGYYMRVKLKDSDKDYLRFLWYDKDGQMTHFRMNSHLFGSVCSSSVAAYALQRICRDENVSDRVRDVINRAFYVDDLLRSENDKDDLREVVYGTKGALAKKDFNLTAIMVNDQELCEEFKAILPVDQVKEIGSDVQSKALGIRWLVSDDWLFYTFRQLSSGSPVTRRSILSQVSSMYDPLGLIMPIVLKGRMIFQDLTRLKLGWDVIAPDDIITKWNSWLASLDDLSSIKFKRCLVPDSFSDGVMELVHFCDGSLAGYGAMSFVRIVNKADIHVALIMSKGRLTPLKQISVPRLELCAAVEAVRLDLLIRREMDLPFIQSTFFTDSEIVRAYIQNDKARYKVFVGNRLSEIRQHTRPEQWRHVPGKLNPSDVLSRGCQGDGLPDMWFNGPDFLRQFKCYWPEQSSLDKLDNDPEIIANTTQTSLAVTDDKMHPVDTLIQYHSSYFRLKRAVAWLLRVKDYLKGNKDKKGLLLTEELRSAEELLISHVQSDVYADEISRLKQGDPVACKSSIVKLDPLLVSGRLVVGGRLRHAAISEQLKRPIILPSSHRLSKLIIKHYHDVGHLGTEWTLSRIRRHFWIINARNCIKGVKRACTICKRLYGPVVQQKMADLPPSRVEPFRPAFFISGMDIYGPYYVKHGRGEAKRHVILFCCFSTRSIHLELLPSLESDSMINALVRFISRRSCPAEIWCDNATTFVGAKNELSKSLKQVDKTKFFQTSRRLNIKWVFNVPYASHHGGVWERLILTVRRVFNAIIHPNARLTDDTLQTFLCEAENLVNSRPITKVSDDSTDDIALTPNHMLVLNGNCSAPLGHFQDADRYRRRWRQVQCLVNSFWKRWIAEYLPILQTRQKWQRTKDNISVNDVMLIMDVSLPRAQWPLGIVTDVIKGRDGLVRSIKLKSRNKIVVRPLSKVVFLEGSY